MLGLLADLVQALLEQRLARNGTVLKAQQTSDLVPGARATEALAACASLHLMHILPSLVPRTAVRRMWTALLWSKALAARRARAFSLRV